MIAAPIAPPAHHAEIPPYSMRKAATVSVAFHLGLFIFTAVGLPFIAKEPPLTTNAINVEIVEISDKTQTDKLAPPVKKEEEPPPEPPREAQTESRQMTAEAPPDLTVPTPPEVEDTKPPEPEPEPPAPEEAVPEPVAKEAEAPKPKPKKKPEAPKPKPQEKVEDTKKQSEQFSSLLKNLAPDTVAAETPDKTATADAPTNQLSQIASLGERLTISEIDAFKQQIAPCWNVQSGSKFAENLVVEIRVFMNPDKTLQNAAIVDQLRYTADSHFRAAADAALRALRNPSCQPFRLPSDKYSQWKTMTIRFDPREML